MVRQAARPVRRLGIFGMGGPGNSMAAGSDEREERAMGLASRAGTAAKYAVVAILVLYDCIREEFACVSPRAGRRLAS